MPRIKQFHENLDNRAVSSANPGASGATAAAFGGDTTGSDALAGLLRDVSSSANSLSSQFGMLERRRASHEAAEREKQVKVDLSEAKALHDPTPALIAAKQAAKEDGSDLAKLTQEAFQGWLQEAKNTIDDPEVRLRFGTYWNNRTQAISAATAQQAEEMRLGNVQAKVGNTLSALENRVRLDPAQYDEALAIGGEALAPHNSLNTEANRTNLTQRLARARFESQVENANSQDQLDDVLIELSDDKWKASLSPKDFDDTKDAIDAKRKSVRKSGLSGVKSSMAAAEAKLKSGVPVDPVQVRQFSEAAMEAGDAQLVARASRIERNGRLLERYGKSGPRAMKDKAQQVRKELRTGKSQATGYLAAAANVEFGAELAKKNPDFAKANGNAVGLYQFMPGTWLDVVRRSGDAVVEGQAGMTDDEVLKKREDPDASTRGAQVLARQNRATMGSALGREITDFETYLGHFLGAGKAVKFLRHYEEDERVDASQEFAVEAEANRSIFFDGDTPRSVGEVYQHLADKFGNTPTMAKFSDAEYLEALAKEAGKRLSDNAVGYGRELGLIDGKAITEEGGVEARAADVRKMASQWDMSVKDIPPLEPSEVDRIKGVLSSENVDEKLNIMTLLSGLGPQQSQAAYKQLGTSGRTYAHAAALKANGGQAAAASSIVKGATYLEQNENYEAALEIKKKSVYDTMSKKVSALVGIMGDNESSGGATQNVMDAAFAHYIQEHVREGGERGLDEDKFMTSVDAVLGGSPGKPAIGEYNDHETVMPQGVTEAELANWATFSKMSDWVGVSLSGLPPRHANGEVADVEDLKEDAQLVAVGANTYAIRLKAGFLTTGKTDGNGTFERYLVRLDEEPIREASDLVIRESLGARRDISSTTRKRTTRNQSFSGILQQRLDAARSEAE